MSATTLRWQPASSVNTEKYTKFSQHKRSALRSISDNQLFFFLILEQISSETGPPQAAELYYDVIEVFVANLCAEGETLKDILTEPHALTVNDEHWGPD